LSGGGESLKIGGCFGSMSAYFIRRLLLIPPTLVGMTMAVFALVQFTPGGRLETALMEARLKESGRGGSGAQSASGLTPSQELKLEEQFGHDKHFLVAYLGWLGAVPRETNRSREEFAEGAEEARVRVPGTAEFATVRKLGGSAAELSGPEGLDLGGWRARVITPEELERRWRKRNPGQELEQPLAPVALIFQPRYQGLLQGNLGESTRYSEPVWDMMKRRFPISIFFGLTSIILTYLVCVPLGVLKAIKHRTFIDNVTSVAIFTGYAIPGFVLGVFLVVVFAARLGWFPLEGFVSPDFADLGWWGKVKDLAHHAALPLICYMVGSFASLTMLLKNNLMDQLAADYVRTAVAKGLDFKRAVFRHALRNAFIPAAATMGQALTIVVGGSFLIERIFDIDGFGLMGFNALLERDTPIIMGTVAVSGLLLMLGNVLSDLINARLDPRIRYE
jgi:microcin C transport system permease protein